MSINSINNMGTTGTNNTNGTNNTGGTGTLNMDDFLQLLVAQLKNQDMYNTMDDSEYMAQMAQFSMLQAITDMSELSMTSYGVSLIGKEVTVGKIGDDGTVESIEGIVDSVNFYNGSPQVVVDDKSYSLSSVMSVNEPNIIIPKGDINDGTDKVDE
ncbi:MAG TPA: flagellar hook capping FlgD N-terminal domain-containing protein [Anaerovoracaceae bacterium]|nr:flagellar hook capping FlgD N-terminal domain-containing protein [Anaerovoracaceae bacterium]